MGFHNYCDGCNIGRHPTFIDAIIGKLEDCPYCGAEGKHLDELSRRVILENFEERIMGNE